MLRGEKWNHIKWTIKPEKSEKDFKRKEQGQ